MKKDEKSTESYEKFAFIWFPFFRESYNKRLQVHHSIETNGSTMFNICRPRRLQDAWKLLKIHFGLPTVVLGVPWPI